MIRPRRWAIICRMDSVIKIFAVAAGGACGAVARYLINVSPVARAFESFPLSTFLINISGSLAIGFLMAITVERFELGETAKLALIVGFLGAFTTFSTYEMEIFSLMRDLASRGFAILFFSTDLAELAHVADRTLVMSYGRIAATLEGAAMTEDAILSATLSQGAAA